MTAVNFSADERADAIRVARRLEKHTKGMTHRCNAHIAQGARKIHFLISLLDKVAVKTTEKNTHKNPITTSELFILVPQTFGEAVVRYPWLKQYPGHEWDNRTTLENAAWLIQKLTEGGHKTYVPDPCKYCGCHVTIHSIQDPGYCSQSVQAVLAIPAECQSLLLE